MPSNDTACMTCTDGTAISAGMNYPMCEPCIMHEAAIDDAQDGYEQMLDKHQVLNMHQLSKPSELELEQAAVERMVKEGRHESPCLITYLAIERQGRNFTA